MLHIAVHEQWQAASKAFLQLKHAKAPLVNF